MKIKSSLIILLLLLPFNAFSQNSFTITSGTKSAMYYPVASSMCQIYNKYSTNDIECIAKESKGAHSNLNLVNLGTYDMGIAQNVIFDDAAHGKGQFKNNAKRNIVKLFNLHYEYLTVISRNDVEIKGFSDIFNKKVNIGNVGSGSRVLLDKMLNEFDKDLNDFVEIYEKSGSDLHEVLCNDGLADLAVYTVGHPNQGFAKLANCNTKINSIDDEEIDKFLTISPKYFIRTKIPANTYLHQPVAINTFALSTTLFTNKDFDQDILNDFLQIMQDNKEELVLLQPSLHPLFKSDISS